MASAKPASARGLRPNGSRLFTGVEVAARSRTMVSITVSIALPKTLPDPNLRLFGYKGVAPSRVRVGGSSRGSTEIRRDERSTAFAVHHHRIGFPPGLAVRDHDARSLRSEIPFAPRAR